MDLNTGFITYNQSKIFYREFGTGTKKLFCFHGYGESSETFIFLKDFLGKDFTLIALDLPFHGETLWNNNLLFTTNDLIKIISSFIANDEKFYLLGFSMGGRIALHLLETVPQKIKQVVLLAPDGLHKNFWYFFSTQTVIGNKVFAYTMKHPAWFLTMIHLSKTIKLINKNSFRFTLQFLDDETNRMLLYNRWMSFRKIKPNLSYLKKLIRRNDVKVNMLFGKFDKIIFVKHGIKFQQGIEDKVSVTKVDAGHLLLSFKYTDEIVKMFNS